MGDFLEIKASDYSPAATPYRKLPREGGGIEFAYRDTSLFWYLAFADAEDACKWYDVSEMEF